MNMGIVPIEAISIAAGFHPSMTLAGSPAAVTLDHILYSGATWLAAWIAAIIFTVRRVR